MPKNVKHYVITALVLGGIAAFSGGLIGLTNMITRGPIATNAANKIKKGLSEIYPDAEYSEANPIDGVQYLDCYYEASKEGNLQGYIFQVSGSNMYGKISMLVGISTSFDIEKIYLVTNEQTYAQTLVDNFVTPYNNGDKGMNQDDVKCGATYGGNLIKDMAEKAQTYAKEHLKGGN